MNVLLQIVFDPEILVRLNWYGIGGLIVYGVDATLYIKRKITNGDATRKHTGKVSRRDKS